ncbi:hypothetical protein Taro_016450 [Colocasia esculenta]|uniref:U1 small nuclear ribonucleoprotein C n=1 Tax=Colocasia esculenta TaxID=4460 RepID=A0A843UT05_COLES|nr:hypothetical protein [Colocasia esculenta]
MKSSCSKLLPSCSSHPQLLSSSPRASTVIYGVFQTRTAAASLGFEESRRLGATATARVQASSTPAVQPGPGLQGGWDPPSPKRGWRVTGLAACGPCRCTGGSDLQASGVKLAGRWLVGAGRAAARGGGTSALSRPRLFGSSFRLRLRKPGISARGAELRPRQSPLHALAPPFLCVLGSSDASSGLPVSPSLSAPHNAQCAAADAQCALPQLEVATISSNNCTHFIMPRYYCDYCDTYLTHDSPSVRKQHNAGYKHKANVRSYYQQFEEQQTQSLIDQRIKEHLGQAAYQVGATYLASLQPNAQSPRLPVLPTPILPVLGASQPPLPSIRPPILPRPLGPPGYGALPPPMQLVAPPGANSAPMPIGGPPRPPMLAPPAAGGTSALSSTGGGLAINPTYQANPSGVDLLLRHLPPVCHKMVLCILSRPKQTIRKAKVLCSHRYGMGLCIEAKVGDYRLGS